mgnify:CR=1 FL=1
MKCTINAKPLPKMRTIRETAELFGVPEYFVRQLVKENKIVYVRAGCKALVNIDRFADFLNGGEQI